MRGITTPLTVTGGLQVERGVFRGVAAIEPTDPFVDPTSRLRRHRTVARPRGEIALVLSLRAAPTPWRDMVGGSRLDEVEKEADGAADITRQRPCVTACVIGCR
ncbi:hypothetical protein [uncultured Piscinibacter sp.]|uniref:hypothetical protein n=1 Tax=uncultured Piscinibacter sp. TaxID=1131835 RepID=UPI0026077535|nr:hypothetical protein [uncultured Piscinibacter sp.]